MRRLPPRRPVGSPKTPGSGRRKGSLNRKTIELRQLMGALVGDVDYQDRLRADFRRRRVHPTIEALVWGHVVGKPAQRVELSAEVSMNQRLEEERELFSRLSIDQMEQLAKESQALVDKAAAMARANSIALVPATVGSAGMATSDTCGPKAAREDIPSAEVKASPAGEPTPATAGLDDAPTGVPAGLSTGQAVADRQALAGAGAAERDTSGRRGPR